MRSALVGPGVVAIAGLRRPLTFSFSQVAVILSGKVGEGRLPCRSRRFNRSAARATRLSAAAAYLPARCYDVVVVGAGIMGACTAAELATTGNSVLLLEQFDLLHRRGSSHGESRITRPTYPGMLSKALPPPSRSGWFLSPCLTFHSRLPELGLVDASLKRHSRLLAREASYGWSACRPPQNPTTLQ